MGSFSSAAEARTPARRSTAQRIRTSGAAAVGETDHVESGCASADATAAPGPTLANVFDDDVWRYSPIGPIPTLVAGSIGLALVLYVTWNHTKRTQTLTWVLLAVCILVILAATVRGSLGNEDGGFGWRLGHSIVGEYNNINQGLGLLNVAGNVVMFVPVGWLAAILARRRNLGTATAAAAGLSLAIEVWQMSSGSFGDIDDVFLNSLGGVLGAALALSIRAISRRWPGRGNHRAAHDVRVRAG